MDTRFRHLEQGYDIKLPLKMLKIQFFNSHRDLSNASESNSVKKKSNLSRYQKYPYYRFHSKQSVILCSLDNCQVDRCYYIDNHNREKRDQVLTNNT